MKVESVVRGFMDIEVGYALRVGGRYYVVLQYSMESHDTNGESYFRCEAELGPLADHGHIASATLKIDLDADKRVMSWRTSGVGLFDRESMRGTPHHYDLSEFESQVRERAPELVEHYNRMVQEAIRAEVEAMDWPDVIDA